MSSDEAEDFYDAKEEEKKDEKVDQAKQTIEAPVTLFWGVWRT